MDKETKQILKDVIKNELQPFLIGIRNDITELTKTHKDGMSTPLAIQFTPEAIREFKHHDGYTPIKGTDYFTEKEISEFLTKATPIKGKHYFTATDIADFKAAVTPVKGVDYADGYTPVKGTDYFTDEEVASFLTKITPVKGIHYHDGAPGARGEKGADGTAITPEQIRNKLESLKGTARLSIKAIRGWQEEIANYMTEKGFGMKSSSQDGGIGGSGGSGSTTSINGLIQEGTNVTITGTGTAADPYIINSSGGGGGSAAGADTQVQFNDGGTTMAGAAGVTYNKTTQVMTLAPATLTGAATTAGFVFNQTYNTSGVAAGFQLNYTNTASANTSRWFAITVGGSEAFSVGRTSWTTGGIRLGGALVMSTSGGSTLLHIGSSGYIQWYDAAGSTGYGTLGNDGISVSPATLTGSTATSALRINQTWNTTGVPAAFFINITNTASSASSTFITLQEGAQNRFRFLVASATLTFGSGSNNVGIGAATSTTGAGAGTGTALRYISQVASATGYAHFFQEASNRTGTSGISGLINASNTFAPTSGTGVYNHVFLAPTINQTGGANGETNALVISPTLTAVGGTFNAIKVVLGRTLVAPSTTTYASIDMPAGVAPSAAADGDMWNDGTNFMMNIAGTTYKISRQIGILSFACQSSTPLASQTYYFGFPYDVSMVNTTAARRQKVVPMAGTIRGAGITVIATAGGTTEQMQVIARINNTTDLVLSNAVQGDQALQTYSITGLSQAIAAGDKIEIKVVTPAWVTAPTTVRVSVDLYIE